jgi:hypothetical protein
LIVSRWRPDCRSGSGASGRAASVIANPQRFGQWLLPAAFILPGVYILQRRGLLAATG